MPPLLRFTIDRCRAATTVLSQSCFFESLGVGKSLNQEIPRSLLRGYLAKGRV